MRVQVVISGLLLHPSCDVGADFLVISAFEDRPITNKVLVYVFIPLGGAAAVDWKYFVRIVIAAFREKCFCQLYTGFMVTEGHAFN